MYLCRQVFMYKCTYVNMYKRIYVYIAITIYVYMYICKLAVSIKSFLSSDLGWILGLCHRENVVPVNPMVRPIWDLHLSASREAHIFFQGFCLLFKKPHAEHSSICDTTAYSHTKSTFTVAGESSWKLFRARRAFRQSPREFLWIARPRVCFIQFPT